MTNASSSRILTKTADPADFTMLTQELNQVDRYPIGHEQHPMRRWEYAMCLRAIRAWCVDPSVPPVPIHHEVVRGGVHEGELTRAGWFVLDIGGAGSSLRDVLTDLGMVVYVIDPRSSHHLTLEKLVAGNHEDSRVPTRAPIVTCISTVEHVPVDGLDRFLDCLCRAVLPGGLLFLTSDIQEGPTPRDEKHFHWMRERIYDPESWFALGRRLIADNGMELFGASDPMYHGDHVYDYSFASMALTRRTGL